MSVVRTAFFHKAKPTTAICGYVLQDLNRTSLFGVFVSLVPTCVSKSHHIRLSERVSHLSIFAFDWNRSKAVNAPRPAIECEVMDALSDLLKECEVAVHALERAGAWPFASRLKDKLLRYNNAPKKNRYEQKLPSEPGPADMAKTWPSGYK